MVQNFIQNLLTKQEQPKPLDIKFMQFNEKGEFDPVLTAERGLQIQQDTTPLTLKDRLFGREMTQDYQIISPDNKNVEMATAVNYKPGLLEDLRSGFKENYTQGFDVNNLVPQNKGLATKIGEGLGTLARFYDKPIGRFAAAAGLSALTGGVNPMNEGITAYVGRQGNIARNKVYGEALKKMGYTDDQLAGINLSDDIFKNTMLSEYRNRLADYRNTKLDKDSFLKSQKQIMDYLDKGLITEDTAQKYLVLLNKKYQEDNPTEVQYGYKKEQGEEKLQQGERKLDIIESLGKGKLGIMQQNADTYAKNQGKTKIEDTDEYKQDYADYVKVMTGTNKKGRRYTKQEQEMFRDKFARKYGKLPKVN